MDKRRRCIGLIGGLGPGAAVHYYKKLTAAHARQHLPLDLVMVHAETSRVFEYAETDDREGLARYLNSFIDRLSSAGADLAVIPAVTPHLCIRELRVLSSLPVLRIFDPLVKELASRSLKRVGVFGTRFVIESSLFAMADGAEVVSPPQEEVEYIHRTYLELAQTGEGSEAQYRGLTDLALNFCKRDHLDAIVFAGTDLSLIFNETNIQFPYIDCAALHIEAILKNVLDEEPLTRTWNLISS
jgi:aspartate racemase